MLVCFLSIVRSIAVVSPRNVSLHGRTIIRRSMAAGYTVMQNPDGGVL